MARLADRVHVGAQQQVRMWPAVGEMTGSAALGVHDRVLEDKRPGDGSVAIRTECILTMGRPRKLFVPRAVWIMTVAAVHQALVYLVTRRQRKLRLDLSMALVAKPGLCGFEQVFRRGGVVNTVATGAADAAFAVRRAREGRVFSRMTGEAHGVSLRGFA